VGVGRKGEEPQFDEAEKGEDKGLFIEEVIKAEFSAIIVCREQCNWRPDDSNLCRLV